MLLVQEQTLVQADLEGGNVESILAPRTQFIFVLHILPSLLKILLLLSEMSRATLWWFLPVASVKSKYQHTVTVHLSRPCLDKSKTELMWGGKEGTTAEVSCTVRGYFSGTAGNRDEIS